jgi:hypothetical protein
LLLISGHSYYCQDFECHLYHFPKFGDVIRSIKGFTFAWLLNWNMGYYYIKLDADAQSSKAIHNCIPMSFGKYKCKGLSMGVKINWFLMFFKISCLNLPKTWNILKLDYYLDDLLISTNSSLKDHLLKLEIVLTILLINVVLIWKWTSPNWTSLQNK